VHSDKPASVLVGLAASLVLLGFAASITVGCQAKERSSAAPQPAHVAPLAHYTEIVSPDADALVTLYQRIHALSFSAPDPDLGGARVATQSDGSLLGIRKPLADHEQPIIRTYRAVDNIELAAKTAEQSGATIAYPPTRQGSRGTFAIVILGGVELGLWQHTAN
jgi:predicted enzyme related to lactoylglutathione lyase